MSSPSPRSAGPRTLRLRSDALPRGAGGAGELVFVPTRTALRPGDAVRVEVSFGALSDEVVLDGHVEAHEGSAGPGVHVRFDPGQEARLRYVSAVVEGGRSAAARRHRRLPSSLPVNWITAGSMYSSRLHDISAGGAFILAPDRESPPLGSRIEVVLRPGPTGERVQVTSIVSWVGRRGAQLGFGVSFKPADPVVAQRLAEVVRRHEAMPS
jgi:Tfp pilus assembly protein PilZ